MEQRGAMGKNTLFSSTLKRMSSLVELSFRTDQGDFLKNCFSVEGAKGKRDHTP